MESDLSVHIFSFGFDLLQLKVEGLLLFVFSST